MALLLKHQTPAQFLIRFREAYRNADRERCIQLARAAISRIQAGDFTDAQFRTVFSMNATQWNALKTKMNNWITAQNTINSAVGE